ncbi:MAG: hypothetical protein JNJ44_04370 [Zoogloeaceae bacterium]|nr:hypothetical protein [Zoogloeaceae bacterium]
MMDPEQIYCRTPEGERLARTPRQIASYSQRATLLLVDGQISVGELIRRFGETLPMAEALAELKEAGLIQAKGDEPSEAAVGADTTATDFREDPLFDPALSEITVEGLVADGAAQEVIASLGDDLPAEAIDKIPPAPFLPPELPPELPAGAVLVMSDRRPDSGPQGLEAPDPGPSGTPLRQRRPAMAVAWVMGLALFVGAGWWASGLRERLEARASATFGVPVTIGGWGVALRPGPGLALNDVRIAAPKALHLSRVEVIPGLGSGGLTRLVVADQTVRPSDIATLGGLLGAQGAWSACRFENLGIALGGLSVEGLEGSLTRDDQGAVLVFLALPGGGLRMTAKPGPGGELAFTLSATPERIPVFGGPAMATVELQGRLSDSALHDGRVVLTGYGGKWVGTLQGDWSSRVILETAMSMTAVSADQVSRSLVPRGGVAEGVVSGTLTARAQGASWADLARIDRLQAQFVVERGALKGFDLGDALRERVARPISGGETRFERLQGRLEVDGGDILLRVDGLDAGALQASGVARIDSSQGLRGSLLAAIRMAGRGALNYPAVLSGTVDRPSIQLRLPAAGGSLPPPGGAER